MILTSDPDFIALHTAGVEHPGIVYYHQHTRTIGQMIEFLLLVDACMSPEEMQNRLEFMGVGQAGSRTALIGEQPNPWERV